MEKNESESGGLTRRGFAFGAAGAAALLAAGSLKFVPEAPVVRPPGGQDEDAMLASCIRCEKCYEACPRHVVRLQHFEEGIAGVRMPVLDFQNDYCDFCADAATGYPLCVSACPTGALSLPERVVPEETILGKAQINRDWCLAYQLIGCRFCYDACPYEAIVLDGDNRPSVIADACNGCGACESACVSLKEGSISEHATSRAIIVVAESQG